MERRAGARAPSATSSGARWQAETCPAPKSISSGTTVVHPATGSLNRHRGWNEHPGGGFSIDGG